MALALRRSGRLGRKATATLVAVSTMALGLAVSQPVVTAVAQAGPSGPTSQTWQSAPNRVGDGGSGPSCYSSAPDSTSPVLTVVAGLERTVSAGPALGARISPQAVVTDPTGDTYIADPTQDIVEEVTPSGALSVVAGVAGQCGMPVAGPATATLLGSPGALALDASGDLFIADADNGVIEEVTPGGQLSIVAGNGTYGTLTPGPATATALGNPDGVAVDSAGDIYIADSSNEVIEKVSAGGTLSVFAGTGDYGAPTPGPATSSALADPAGLAVGTSGDLYIADSRNDVVEEVTPAGTLSVFAGTGDYGAPTPGPATSSALADPAGLAVGTSGDLYIADSGNDVVEQVTPAGTLSIVAGTGAYGTATPGPATSSALADPAGLAVGTSGDLYIADYGNGLIEQVTPAGTLSVVAGIASYSGGLPTNGPAASSALDEPGAVATDSAGDLFIADMANCDVEEVSPSGDLSVVAGVPGQCGSYTPGPPTSSELGYVTGVAVDAQGDLYIADAGNGVVEEVTGPGTANATLSMYTAIPGEPTNTGEATGDAAPAIAIDASGDLFIADWAGCDVEELVPGAALSVVAGEPGQCGQPSAGPATSSELGNPTGIAVDSQGDILIADPGNDVVEEVSAAGTSGTATLSVLDGTPGEPGPASSFQLDDPTGVVVDGAGDVFISDTSEQGLSSYDNTVVEVSSTGSISTVVGDGSSGIPTPGPATSSSLGGRPQRVVVFADPTGLALDNAGDLYIADEGSNDVEEVAGLGVSASSQSTLVDQLNPQANPTGGSCTVPYSSGTGLGGTPQVVHESVDLSQFAGQDVALQFSFNTNGDTDNAFEGWFVRNVKVTNQGTTPSNSNLEGPTAADANSTSTALPTFDDPVSDGDTNFTPSSPGEGTTSSSEEQATSAVVNDNSTGSWADQPPYWQTSDTQDSTMGGPAWWFGNQETGTYQTDPGAACPDGASSSGTITTTALVQLGADPVLSFDTMWEIGSANPASTDLMDVNVLTGSAGGTPGGTCDSQYDSKVQLGTRLSVGVANLSGYNNCYVDKLVNEANKGMHTYCGTPGNTARQNEESDDGTTQYKDPQDSDLWTQMHPADLVVVTDNAMYWLDYTYRSGLLAGMWALDSSGGLPDFVNKTSCGTHQNDLLPGSSGEEPPGAKGGWLGDGMEVLFDRTKGPSCSSSSKTGFQVQHSNDHPDHPDLKNATLGLHQVLTSDGAPTGVYTLTLLGHMVRYNYSGLTSGQGGPKIGNSGLAKAETVTDCAGESAKVGYVITYTFGSEKDTGNVTTPDFCQDQDSCTKARNWLGITVSLKPDHALQVNNASISFSLDNIAAPWAKSGGDFPVKDVHDPFIYDVASVDRDQFPCAGGGAEATVPAGTQGELQDGVAQDDAGNCAQGLLTAAPYLANASGNKITEGAPPSVACKIDGSTLPTAGLPSAQNGSECPYVLEPGNWTTLSKSSSGANDMAVTLLQPEVAASSTGQFRQRAQVNSGIFNVADNTTALDDGFAKACDTGSGDKLVPCSRPGSTISDAAIDALQAKGGMTYDYSVDVMAGSVGRLLNGTVTEKATDPAVPVAGATVDVHDLSNTTWDGTTYPSDYSATTATDGTWNVGGLPPGDYEVEASAPVSDDLIANDTTADLTANGDATADLSLSTSAGTMNGTVSGPGGALAGAEVEVCEQVQAGPVLACPTATTDDNGQWSVGGLPAGAYTVTANPPSPSNGLGDANVAATAVAGEDVGGVDLTLPGLPEPLPSGTTVSGIGSYGGAPLLEWEESASLATQGCANGSASATIAGYQFGDLGGSDEGDVPETVDVALNESPAGSGNYTGQTGDLYPMHGQATVSIELTCPDPSQDQSFSFTVYIDPSGTVLDQDGNPVSGATVTLLSSTSPAGPFSAVGDGSAVMSPDNRTNPMTTGASGMFGWDVLAGYYQVEASAPGCISASGTSQSVATSPVFEVPPSLEGLQLALDCEADAPTTLTYTGPTTADSGSLVNLTAVLASPALPGTALPGGGGTPGPIAGEQVSISFAGQSCSATTDTTGTASCTVIASNTSGAASASASFAGDAWFQAASTTDAVTVTADQPTLGISAAGTLQYGLSSTFSAYLADESGTGIAGQEVDFVLGSGASAQSCSATTDATGMASCVFTVAQPAGPETVQASFAGTSGYGAASASAQTTVAGEGYWLVGADGSVYAEGGASTYGSLSAQTTPGSAASPGTSAPAPAGPVVAMASTPDGAGYWLVSANGDVYSFGDATGFCDGGICNSLAASPVSGEIVGIAADPAGEGYWLVGSDGTVYPLSGATSYGSPSALGTPAPIVAIAASPDGGGYWLAASDGTVYALGDASGFCTGGLCSSLASSGPQAAVVTGISAAAPGEGYWLVGSDGTVYPMSGALAYGSSPVPAGQAAAVGIAASPDGEGYWVASADGNVAANGDTEGFCASGSCAPSSLASDIVGVAPLGMPFVAPNGTTSSNPSINWPSPGPITYGSALSAAQLDAAAYDASIGSATDPDASLSGTFSYDPPVGTVLGAGQHTLSVSFVPDDTVDYTDATATTTVTVGPATPAITWPSPAAITYGTALSGAQLDASASVPGTFTYTPAAGTVLSPGAHTLDVTFSPADATGYTTATASVTITVNKATPTITWASPVAITYGTALSGAQLDASASVPGTFTYTPALGTVLQPGSDTLSVTFSPSDTTDYATSTASQTLSVGFTATCITTTVTGSLAVAKGQSVCIKGAKVTGSISVSPGGALWVSGASVGGSVSSSGASALTLLSTTLTGSLSASSSSGPVIVGGSVSTADTIGGSVSISANKDGVIFSNDKVTGSVSISANSGGVVASSDTVGGSVSVATNSGGVTFTDNIISGSLAIVDNTGPFDYSGNTVKGSVSDSGNT